MSSVKIMGGPIKEPPKPTKYADIEGQGRIPYATLKDEKTPNIAKAKITKGKRRGMGAALRGAEFTNA
ncbi:MAG: hypothetical protein ACPHDJ_06885 [Candidatus Puniceispirillaceae bacterium]|jgi:hypothetical protein